jgi:hypothetical protein
MIGSFRAGGWAAALSALVALFATPSQAATQSPIQQPVAAVTPGQAPVQARVQQSFAAISAAPTYAQPAVVQQGFPTTMQPAPYGAVPVQRSLGDLVAGFVNRGNQDEEQLCLAKAIYFEARGESLEGQLAVAEVVLNRAASGRYPPSICGVVTQRSQFSFIRRGRFPSVDPYCVAWQTALAVANVARNRLVDQIPPNVLWYHANYVSPSWGRRLTRVTQIGGHIFYG